MEANPTIHIDTVKGDFCLLKQEVNFNIYDPDNIPEDYIDGMKGYGQTDDIVEPRPVDLHEEAPAEPLDDVVFSPRIFTKNDHLVRARNEISMSIDLGESCDPSRSRIDPTVQGQWYYIEKAIRESKASANRFQTKQFLEQMIVWLPDAFDYCKDEDEKAELVKKFGASVSAEKRLWKNGNQEVPILDMKTHARSFGLDMTKANLMCKVCLQLKTALDRLVDEISKEN